MKKKNVYIILTAVNNKKFRIYSRIFLNGNISSINRRRLNLLIRQSKNQQIRPDPDPHPWTVYSLAFMTTYTPLIGSIHEEYLTQGIHSRALDQDKSYTDLGQLR